MPERVRRPVEVDEHQAQDRLNSLSLYAERAPGRCARELRELRAIHAEDPVDARVAYAEALDVLGSELAAFEDWTAGHPGRARWPTAQDVAMRERVRG